MKKLGWFAFFLMLCASCLDDPDCYQLHNDFVGVTFRVMGTGQGDSVLVKNFSTDKFEYGPSFLYQINYFVEERTFDFEFEGVDETNFLTFGYTVKNQFISEDCGSAFILSNLGVVAHDFDSARIINATPSKGGGTNIEVYRCPETDTMAIDFSQLYATSDGVIITNKTTRYVSRPFDSITTDFSGVVFTGRGATINLPVDTTKAETEFIFNTSASVDTIVVGYNRVTEQRYTPCGIQTFVNELAIKHHTFDSVSFGLDSNEEPARTLEDPHIANLRVFECPFTNLMLVDFKSNGAPKTVTMTSITGDHFAGNYLTGPLTSPFIQLEVDLFSDTSTFYIQYDTGAIDTLRVAYTRTDLTLFPACPDRVINGLSESPDLPNIAISPNGTVLRYPAVPNVEITVD